MYDRHRRQARPGDQWRPRVVPLMTQSRGGSSRRSSSHGRSCSQPQASMPTSRRRPPLPRRTSNEPRWSRSPSVSASASWMRKPARPHDHDQPAQAPAVSSVASGTHNRDDLLHLRRIGGIAQTLVARRMAGVETGQRRGRSASTGMIEQQLGPDPSSGSLNEPDYRARGTPQRPVEQPTLAFDTEQRSRPIVAQCRRCLNAAARAPVGPSAASRPTQQRAGAPGGAPGLLLCREAGRSPALPVVVLSRRLGPPSADASSHAQGGSASGSGNL